jgi:alpha-galactosidase
MTTIADLNDKWAAYAGPGGWNGKNLNFVKQKSP